MMITEVPKPLGRSQITVAPAQAATIRSAGRTGPT
jgi:hypothetical protein